ncbi:endonuclease NucS domain-containing protein [Rubrivirga marina]|uniref:endonuclease NucS domain-containing protein n=1 Tax=Rubrivirga marina TaxID=1196024 RepID=UPI0015C907ED|nr:endonuclease NucS domain-containing protein [Rubrivirga marina]
MLDRFGPTFTPDRVATIDAEEFQAFLAFKNNRHWTGLERQGPKICSDMPALREALGRLLDESRPIGLRATEAVDMVTGMGRAIATAVLQVAYPGEYGVLNSTSEGGMRAVGLWPEFARGLSFGEKYDRVNQVLVKTTAEVGVDLWTLDALWYIVLQLETTEAATPAPVGAPSADAEPNGGGVRFGLERHLHDFLRDNWDSGPFGAEWALHAEPGDDEAGYEYPCDVGRIDLLARHRRTRDWLVIELKRAQSSDQTIGQVLRYVGWVEEHLAEDGEGVRGLIVAHDADLGLLYALRGAHGVDLKLYEVEFNLRDAPSI